VLAQRRLAEASRLLASTLDLTQVLDRLADITVELLHADVVAIWLLNGEDPAMTLGAQAGSVRVPGPRLPAQRGAGLTGVVLASGAPFAVEDLATEPRVGNPEWFAAEGLRSFLGVPLLVDGAPVGVLCCMRRARRAWSTDDRESADALGTAAAAAFRNARLYAETRQQLNQMETLTAVSRAVNSTLDFTEAMRCVAREVGRALSADMVGAYVTDEDRELLRPVAGYHVPRDLLARFLDTPFSVSKNPAILEGWRTRQPVWILDAPADSRMDPEILRWAPVRSGMFFPLVVKEESIGGLFLIWWEPRPAPSAMELSLLEGIAGQTALAIGNARLFAAGVRDAQRLQALNEVSRSLAAILEPQAVFATIARLAAGLLDARVVRLWLFDPKTGDLGIVASDGTDAARAARTTAHPRIGPGQGLIGRIFETRQPEFIADVREDSRALNRATAEDLALRGFAGVPLVLKDAVVGVLAVLTGRLGEFDASTRSLVEAFASQAALAIHNARTFGEVERRLRDTEALLGVADSVVTAGDVAEIVRRVCREATRALGADSAVFYSVDDEAGVSTPVAGYRVPKAVLQQARPLSSAEVPAAITAAVREHRMVVVADAQADPAFAIPSIRALGVRSLLASPIHAKERSFGVLLLYWWHSVHETTDEELALMGALSAQAGLALENSRLLDETQAQATALREKNAELDSFVYTVSHDLRAPLVTIQGMVDLVIADHSEHIDEDGRHYLGRIDANTRQMERLLLDLLALSRIGRDARPPETLALADVVDDVLAELSEPLRARGIKVTVADLPTVSAVRVELEQVLRNLLTNAVKYMGDTPAPAIEIGAAGRGATVEVWVRDTGIGIDAAYHERVFEIFHRLKQISADGTGVGLAIVKKIVERAGGRIWVESVPGEGATFRFTWPAGPWR
jgi:GAF domain-containing protein